MKSPSTFERLVLGCMDSYDSNQIVIFSAFFEIYKILILLHRSDLKISAKTRPNFCRNENEISFFHSRFSMKFAIFRRKFNEILHRNVQEMTNCLDILRRSARKNLENARNFRNLCEIFIFISFFHSSPYSIGSDPTQPQLHKRSTHCTCILSEKFMSHR